MLTRTILDLDFRNESLPYLSGYCPAPIAAMSEFEKNWASDKVTGTLQENSLGRSGFFDRVGEV